MVSITLYRYSVWGLLSDIDILSQDGVGGFNCTCVAGYTNHDCSINIDDCVMNPCQNGGTCVVCSTQQ